MPSVDQLSYWLAHKEQSNFQFFLNLVRVIFAVSAASSKSERVFSAAGNILTSPKRASLNPEKVKECVIALSPEPGPKIPTGACQPIFNVAGSSERKRVFRDRFYMINWFDGLSFRIKTTNIVGAVPTIGYHFSEKEIIKEKMPKIDTLDALDDEKTSILNKL